MKNKFDVLKALRLLRMNLEKSHKGTPLTEVPVPAAILLDDVITALQLSSFERGYILGGVARDIDTFWESIKEE